MGRTLGNSLDMEYEQEFGSFIGETMLRHLLGVVSTILALTFLVGGTVLLLYWLQAPAGAPLVLYLLLLYGWTLYTYFNYKYSRQNELLQVLAAAAEANTPLAPALKAYLQDRPHGSVREFLTSAFLFFALPGYYWFWDQRHSFDRKVSFVIQLLDAGASLSHALAAVPGLASRETVLAAAVGENTGRLAFCLRQIAQSPPTTLWLEVAPRLLYPVGLLIFISLVAAFWMTYLAPKMKKIYADFNYPLPDVTFQFISALNSIEAFSLNNSLLKQGLLGGLAFLILLVISSSVRWYCPGIGRFSRRLAQGRVLQMLGMMLAASRPVPEALEFLAASPSFSPIVRRRLKRAQRWVEQGEPLAPSLRRGSLLPRSMAPLLQTSERIGNLPWALTELGNLLTTRTIRLLRRLSFTIYPLLVCAVGVLVCVFVLAMFMPLIDLLLKVAE